MTDPKKPANPPGPPETERDGEEQVDVKDRPKSATPRRYRVIFHNDDYTTMEFVVFVLQTVFQHEEAEAVHIMLAVHLEGVGVAGIYTYEIAETKVAQVENLARAREFPLLCTVEEN